jgi:hypothetical protein
MVRFSAPDGAIIKITGGPAIVQIEPDPGQAAVVQPIATAAPVAQPKIEAPVTGHAPAITAPFLVDPSSTVTAQVFQG